MTTQTVEAKIYPTQDGNLEAFSTPAGCVVRQKSDNFGIALIVWDLKDKAKQIEAGATEETWVPKFAKVQPVGNPEGGKAGHNQEDCWVFLEKFDLDDPSTVDQMEADGHIIRGIDSIETGILMAELAYAADNAITQNGGLAQE